MPASISYQWRHNGMPLAGATNRTYAVAASLGSAGEYSIVVSNSVGAAVSPSIKVEFATPQFLGALQSGTTFSSFFQGEPGRRYSLETSTNLLNWTTLTGLLTPDGEGRLQEEIDTNLASRFFRARQETLGASIRDDALTPALGSQTSGSAEAKETKR